MSRLAFAPIVAPCRKMIDVLTEPYLEFLFAPTEGAVTNLRTEGIKKGSSGRRHHGRFVELRERRRADKVHSTRRLRSSHGYFVLTMHRAGNTDDSVKARKGAECYS